MKIAPASAYSRRGLVPGRGADRAEALPGQPRAEPVGAQERVERATGAQLPAAEPGVEALGGGLVCAACALELVEEAGERTLDPVTERPAPRPVERPCVPGDLAADGLDRLAGAGPGRQGRSASARSGSLHTAGSYSSPGPDRQTTGRPPSEESYEPVAGVGTGDAGLGPAPAASARASCPAPPAASPARSSCSTSGASAGSPAPPSPRQVEVRNWYLPRCLPLALIAVGSPPDSHSAMSSSSWSGVGDRGRGRALLGLDLERGERLRPELAVDLEASTLLEAADGRAGALAVDAVGLAHGAFAARRGWSSL